MSFAWPHLLWLLALPAGLLAWDIVRQGRGSAHTHPKILRAQAGLRTLSLSAGTGEIRNRRVRSLLTLGLGLGIVALARPQWGLLDEPVFDQSREIIIALDLSRSMTSPDVKPTRLDRARLLVESLLDRLQGERVGLIVFSGTAFLQSPLSADYEVLRDFLPTLGPDFLPEGGTNYGQLLDTALDAFGSGASADRYLIILSDGEATDEGWQSRTGELSQRGIKVIGFGVGTQAGSMIPDGAGGFLKDENGAVVLSKLESATLRELAGATHGAYQDASEWVDIAKVLASTVEEGRRGRFVEHHTVRRVDRFQWALAPALVFLLTSFWLEFPVRPRPREVRLETRRAQAPKAPLAAGALVLGALLLWAPARAQTSAPPDPAASLSRIVGRLSAQDACSALDWSELARETVTWGQHLQSAGQEVPERPVRDALSAVEQGSSSGPRVADWQSLRQELAELLKKPEKPTPPPQQQKQQKKDDKDSQQKQQNQGQQQQQQDGGGKNSDSSKDGSQDQSAGQPQGAQNPHPENSPSGQAPRDDAFGNMAGRPPEPTPAPSPGEVQKVGGAREDKTGDPAARNPELAVPLEKLEQVKNQDSPAELFEMLRKGEPLPPTQKPAKDW